MDFTYIPGIECDEVRVFMRSSEKTKSKPPSTKESSPALTLQSSTMLSAPSTLGVRPIQHSHPSNSIKSTSPSTGVNIVPPLPSNVAVILSQITTNTRALLPQSTPPTPAVCNHPPTNTNQQFATTSFISTVCNQTLANTNNRAQTAAGLKRSPETNNLPVCNQTLANTNNRAQTAAGLKRSPETNNLHKSTSTTLQRPFCSPKQCMLSKKNTLPTQLKTVQNVSPFKPVEEQPAEVVTPYKKDEDVRQSSDSSSSDSESDTQ